MLNHETKQNGFEDVIWLFNCDRTRNLSRVNIDEAGLLWKYLKRTGNTVVEIGSLRGGTTTLILMALNGKQKFYSIDKALRHAPKLVPFLQKCKTAGTFEMVIGDSGSTTIIEKIGLLFVDGDHTYEGVRRDVYRHWNNVVMGGMILFHDGAPNKSPGHCEGVERIINELLENGVAIKESVVRSMVALRKLEDLAKERIL